MLPEDLRTRLKKPIVIMGWGRAERYSWDATKASASLRINPGYLDPAKQEPMFFGSYDYLDDMQGYYYYSLSMRGWTFGDRVLGSVSLESARYRDMCEVSAAQAKRMDKTFTRMEKREESWRSKQSSSDLYGNEAEIKAFCHALNTDRVWLIESERISDGRLVNVDEAIQWMTKKGSDLALQCRIITGKHHGEIVAYTSAPEDLDGFSARTVVWLDYKDRAGRRYRQISLEGRDWQWQLSRNFSGLFNLLQQHEFDALIPILESWENTTVEQAEVLP